MKVAATSGYNVTIVEVNAKLIDQANATIKNSLQRVARKQFKDDASAQEKFIGDTTGRIKGSDDLKETVKSTDLVIEAIVENIKIKQNLFATIDEVRSDAT